MPFESNASGDAVWVGPRSLRVFLRENRLFATWSLAVTTFMAIGIWIDVGDVSSPFLFFPLGAATGGAVWLALMFAFSRGWIAEGE